MNKKFKNKNFLIGITGGVAIYKTCDLVRKIRSLNGNVVCLMTDAATKFISPMLFEQLSQNKVFYNMFEDYEHSTSHISLSNWADIVVVVPCSCNTLSKLATGKTEDLLTATIYALDKNKKVILCPSMNVNMWNNIITQKNLKILKDVLGYKIILPEKGALLCGQKGVGRLPSIDNILKFISLQL